MNIKNCKGNTVLEALIFLLTVVLIIRFSCVGAFVNQDIAVRALNKQGYTNITITNHEWFFVGWRGCGDSDAAKFKAQATNPAGERTEVFVCTGWLFKGATIRTD